MSAHSYCWKCGHATPKATIKEVVEGIQTCRHCDFQMQPNVTQEEMILEFDARLRYLEDLMAGNIAEKH